MSPTLYQTDLRITNHRRQKFPASFTLLSFKTQIKWPLGWPQPHVFRVIFSTPAIFKATSKRFVLRVAPMAKTDLLFPAFSSKFVDFAVQFCFRSKYISFHEKRRSKCGKNISDTLGYASCATFLFLPHFDVICDLLLNRRTATRNLFVKCKVYNRYITNQLVLRQNSKTECSSLFNWSTGRPGVLFHSHFRLSCT